MDKIEIILGILIVMIGVMDKLYIPPVLLEFIKNDLVRLGFLCVLFMCEFFSIKCKLEYMVLLGIIYMLLLNKINNIEVAENMTYIEEYWKA